MKTSSVRISEMLHSKPKHITCNELCSNCANDEYEWTFRSHSNSLKIRLNAFSYLYIFIFWPLAWYYRNKAGSNTHMHAHSHTVRNNFKRLRTKMCTWSTSHCVLKLIIKTRCLCNEATLELQFLLVWNSTCQWQCGLGVCFSAFFTFLF